MARILRAVTSHNLAISQLLLAQFLLASRVMVVASAPPEPFVAELHVIQNEFRNSDTNLVRSVEGLVTVLYSNKWWQIEAIFQNPGLPMVTIENCMIIPDGTRRFVRFAGNSSGVTVADACPIKFPPPGSPFLFVAWLAMCPNPELPIIKDKQIYRFATVSDCRPSLLRHDKNVGTFDMSYIQPGAAFIEKLNVVNNGMVVSFDLENNEVAWPLRPPFDAGFLEFEYAVSETTNISGVMFPSRATLKRTGPRSTNELGVFQRVDLTVRRIQRDWAKGSIKPPEVPNALFAVDTRPKGLPKDRDLGYLVTNDQWKGVSDPFILERVGMAGQITNSAEQESVRRTKE